jgi:hypothetical protein
MARRRYQTRAETLGVALGIILDMQHEAADREGFIRITSDPTKEVAKKMGYATGGARGVIRDLKDQGIIEYFHMGGEKRADGHRGHAWLIKLPEEEGGSAATPPEEQLKLEPDEGGHPPELVELEQAYQRRREADEAFAAAYARVVPLVVALSQATEERDQAIRERD